MDEEHSAIRGRRGRRVVAPADLVDRRWRRRRGRVVLERALNVLLCFMTPLTLPPFPLLVRPPPTAHSCPPSACLLRTVCSAAVILLRNLQCAVPRFYLAVYPAQLN